MRLSEFFHVLNPSGAHRSGVQSFFKEHSSLRCSWVERFSHPTHLETILDWTQVEGEPRVAIWGGDGTLNRAIQYFYRRNVLKDVTLAILPAGTCNDFSRKIQGSLWQDVSRKGLFQDGSLCRYDVGLLSMGSSARPFINNAGFGREASAVKRRKSNPLRDILSFTEKTSTVRWPEGEMKKALFLGVVCNAPYFSGGLHFSKTDDPADGLLNGHFEERQSRFLLFLKFMKGRLKKSMADCRTIEITAPWIEVSAEEPFFPQVDGEAVFDEGVNHLRFSLLSDRVMFQTWS